MPRGLRVPNQNWYPPLVEISDNSVDVLGAGNIYGLWETLHYALPIGYELVHQKQGSALHFFDQVLQRFQLLVVDQSRCTPVLLRVDKAVAYLSTFDS